MHQRQFVLGAACHVDAWERQPRITIFREGRDQGESGAIDAYTTAIAKNGRVNHVWPFAMFDELGRLIHWLIFATNNLKGLEAMKKAMWKADETGTYRFSDRDNPDQQRFLTGFDDEWLSEELAQRLRGRTLSDDQLFEYVLKETPCYKFKTAINVLRSSGRVSPTTKTYPVRFH